MIQKMELLISYWRLRSDILFKAKNQSFSFQNIASKILYSNNQNLKHKNNY